jgi:hypothetical protein
MNRDLIFAVPQIRFYFPYILFILTFRFPKKTSSGDNFFYDESYYFPSSLTLFERFETFLGKLCQGIIEGLSIF